jgi:hypothetical protein
VIRVTLGAIEPKVRIPELPPAILSDDLSSFSMQILGWEIEPPHSAGTDDEWVVVRIAVNTDGREWVAQAAPFTARALLLLIDWLDQLARGQRVDELFYDDPELEFAGSIGADGTMLLRILLHALYVPDELDDPDNGFPLYLRVDPAQLAAFVEALQTQAQLVESWSFRP